MLYKTQAGRISTQYLSTETSTNDYGEGARVDSSGNIYFIGGSFWRDYFPVASSDPNYGNSVYKINQNGDLDTAFMANTGTQGLSVDSSYVHCIDIDPITGDIVLVGSFDTWNGNSCPSGIIRLTSAGVPVSAYNTNLGAGFQSIYPQFFYGQVAGMTDDVWLSAGEYGAVTITLNFNGTDTIQDQVDAYNLLNPNNQIWTDLYSDLSQVPDNGASIAFEPAESGGAVSDMRCAFNSDGELLVTGEFMYVNFVYGEGAAIVNADGTHNTTFSNAINHGFFIGYYGSEPEGGVWTDSNTSVVLGGHFNGSDGFMNNGCEGIVKLSTAGVQDATFMANAGTGFNSGVGNGVSGELSIVQDSGGNLFCIGSSDGYNGTDIAYGITKLSGAGILNTTFDSNLGGAFQGFYGEVDKLIVDGGDNLLVFGGFVQIETLPSPTPFNNIGFLNNDGVINNTFQANMGTGLDDYTYTGVLFAGVITTFGGFTEFDGDERAGAAQINDDGTNNNWFYPVTVEDSWTAPAGVTKIGIAMVTGPDTFIAYNMQIMDVVPGDTYTIDPDSLTNCTIFGTYRYQGYNNIRIWWMD